MLNKKKLFIIITVLIVSVFIGFRSVDIGKDTAQYIRHYENALGSGHFKDNFELGYSALMYVFTKTSVKVNFFFTAVAFIITYSYNVLFLKIFFPSRSYAKLKYLDIFYFLGLLFLSSWYLAFTTNGLRQGLALPFLYLSIYFFKFEKNRSLFFLLFIISILFHTSMVLVLPFLFFLKLRRLYLWFVWIILLVGYYYGINESFVFYFSHKTHVPLHTLIKYYAVARGENPGHGLYYGFDWNFIIYTAFWPIISEMFLFSNYMKKSIYTVVMKDLISVYLILNMAYFVFGFAAFSNRYAAISWFFIPLIQYGIIKLLWSKVLNQFQVMWSFAIILVYFVMFKLGYAQ